MITKKILYQKKVKNIKKNKKALKSIKNKKKEYDKLVAKGGAKNVHNFNTLVFGDDDQNSPLKKRFEFFNSRDIIGNSKEKLIKLYNELNKDDKKTLEKSGSVVGTNKITLEDSPVLTDETESYQKKVYKLLSDEKIVESRLSQNNYSNASLFYVNSHGAHHKLDLFKVPDNTYICFTTTINNLSYAFGKIDLGSNKGIMRGLTELNKEKFKNIIKCRGALAESKKGVVLKNTNKYIFSNFMDCFDNSTWYYPGQFCNNYNLEIYASDIDISQKDRYYNTYRKITRYYLDNKDGKEILSIEYLKKYYDIFNELLFQKRKKFVFDLKNLSYEIKDKYKEDKIRIIILSACRILDLGYNESVKLIRYEAFIHFMNLKITKLQEHNVDLNIKCLSLQKSIHYLSMNKLENLSNKEIYYENPNLYRLNPKLIELFKEIKEKAKKIDSDKLSKVITFDEIGKLLSDNQFKFIGSCNLEIILIYLLKIYKEIFIDSSELTNLKSEDLRLLLYEKFIYDFFIENSDNFTYLLNYFLKYESNIFGLYSNNFIKLSDNQNSSIIRIYTELYILMINILDKIQKRGSNLIIFFNVMIMKQKLFNKKSTHKLFGINYKLGENKKNLYQILNESFTYRNINLGQGLISDKSRLCNKVIPEDTFFYDASEEKRDIENIFQIDNFKIGEKYTSIKNVELQKCSVIDIDKFLLQHNLSNIKSLTLKDTSVTSLDLKHFKLSELNLINNQIENIDFTHFSLRISIINDKKLKNVKLDLKGKSFCTISNLENCEIEIENTLYLDIKDLNKCNISLKGTSYNSLSLENVYDNSLFFNPFMETMNSLKLKNVNFINFNDKSFDFLQFIEKLIIDGLIVNDEPIYINKDILEKVKSSALLKDLELKNIKIEGPYNPKLYNKIKDMILAKNGNINISLL